MNNNNKKNHTPVLPDVSSNSISIFIVHWPTKIALIAISVFCFVFWSCFLHNQKVKMYAITSLCFSCINWANQMPGSNGWFSPLRFLGHFSLFCTCLFLKCYLILPPWRKTWKLQNKDFLMTRAKLNTAEL